MSFNIGNAPVSWGIDELDPTKYPPWQKVLDEMAEAGYAGTELGSWDFMPTDPGRLREELAKRNLRLTAGNFMGILHDPDVAGDLQETARKICALLQELEALYWVVVPGLADDRARTAGRSQVARRLDDAGWATLVNTLSACANIAKNDYGVTVVFHPHAGTHVEFADEIETLVDRTDPDLVSLCIDTGHSAYARIDPVDLYRSYRERIPYLHLKDIDPDVHQKALDIGMSFQQAYGAGAFCLLGSGVVDFNGLREVLEQVGYEGWLTVEQDADPVNETNPKEDAIKSLEYLKSVGLAGNAGKRR